SLPGAAECADTTALTTAVPPSSDPRVADIQHRLAQAKALAAAGKDGEALPILHALPVLARATGYVPVQAEAQLALAKTLQEWDGELPGAETALRGGIRLGAAAKMDQDVARAWTTLLWVLGQERRYEEALPLRTAAEAALERAGSSPRLQY